LQRLLPILHNDNMQNIPKKLILNNALPPNDTYTEQPNAFKPPAQLINELKIPNLSKILKLSEQSFRQTIVHDALNTPDEIATARALGWGNQDGELPFAQLKALELGLITSTELKGGSWAFITLCSWHVQHGQVTFSADAQDLGLDHDASEQVLNDIKPYFDEDSIHIFTHPELPPGQWLAYSDHFNDLACASLKRVSGRVIDDFLIGTGKSANHKSERLLRRLQNEMQMLLYQHSINDKRSVLINSFWISGTGALDLLDKDFQHTLDLYRNIKIVDIFKENIKFLSHDHPEWFKTWSSGWQHIDATYLKELLGAYAELIEGTEISLCNDTSCITLTPVEQSWSRKLKSLFSSSKISQLLSL